MALMKRAILPTLTLAALLATTAASAQEAAATPAANATAAAPEVVNGDSFTLALPAGFSKAEKREQQLGTAENPIKQVTYISKTSAGQVCILTYSEMSGKILDPEKMMTNGRDSLIKSLAATVDSDQKLSISGHDGHSVVFTATKPRPIFARTDMLVDGPRMYQVIYLGAAKEELDSSDVKNLFASFTVKPTATANTAAAAPTTPAATTASSH